MKPPIEEMFTIAPAFCARMSGRTARVTASEAEKIGLEHGADVGVVAFFDGGQVAVAGVVDQHVDAPELLLRHLDGGLRASAGLVDVEP